MRKKCGIITFSHAINYGAVLQTYALQKYLRTELNIDAEVINYASDGMLLPYKKHAFTYFMKPRILASTLIKNSYIRYNNVGFENFRRRNIVFSGPLLKKSNELRELNKVYDFFITGSDQVFNIFCSNYDYNYLLEFVSKNSKKNSYSASLGITSIPEEYKARYQELLCGFNMISVREYCSVEILEPILGKKPTVTIDPTLLLDRDSWMRISEKVENLPPKYILLYMISEDREIIQVAKSISKKEGLSIVYISDRLFKPAGVKTLRNIIPEQWIYLFANSEIVLTNSYHGVVFSCNFGKRFIPFLLKSNTQVNSRIMDFLDRYHVSNLLYSGMKNKTVYDYNSDEVRCLLETDKKASELYLRDIVNSYQ